MIPQTWSRSVLGLVVGAVVLALVTALLTAAVFSFNAAGEANDLSRKFIEANRQLTDLRDADEDSRARSDRAQRERAELLQLVDGVREQNMRLQRQVSALNRYLREHDIEVPVIAPPVPPKPGRPHKTPKPPPSVNPPKPTPTTPAVPDGCLFPPPFCLALNL